MRCTSRQTAVKREAFVYFGARPSSFYHRGPSARLVPPAVDLDDAAKVYKIVFAQNALAKIIFKQSFPCNFRFGRPGGFSGTSLVPRAPRFGTCSESETIRNPQLAYDPNSHALVTAGFPLQPLARLCSRCGFHVLNRLANNRTSYVVYRKS